MPRIDFADPHRYELAAIYGASLGARLEPDGLAIDAGEPLAALLGRIAQGLPAVLPTRLGGHDEWAIVGATRRDLDAALTGVSRFVVPTYAEHEGGAPSHRRYDPEAGSEERLRSSIYPAGYYLLRSPAAHFTRIMGRLGRWAALESARPQARTAQPPGYRELYEAFSAALSAGTWDVAGDHLAELRRRGLATAENLAFLDVQLLAQQRRWSDLWRREDYGAIAQLRAPRAVRDALLAAFHQSVLLPLEQEGRMEEAIATYRAHRSRLGGLLEGGPDTSYGPALRAFAYREASAGERAALERLVGRASDDETRSVVEGLIKLLPAAPALPTAPPPPEPAPQRALRVALLDGEYDTAWAAAERLSTPAERARGLMDVAYLSEDAARAEEALLQLWALPQPEQDALLGNRRVAQMVAALGAVVSPSAPPAPSAPSETPITDWLTWLSAVGRDPDDPRLPRAVHTVAAADDRYWTEGRVGELAERLIELAAGGAALSRPHMRDAIRLLRDHFIQDAEFPRPGATYGDVYEALYTATLEQREVNEATTMALLRLAETRLRSAPAALAAVAGHLRSWLAEPVPALGAAVLEALDLLAAYGSQGPELGSWLRTWAEAVLALPRGADRATLEGWLTFSEWAQPGPDLLERLRGLLEALDAAAEDPLALLPSGYTIGIFTLRPDSAARVGEMLRRRNPGVRVRLCDDTVLTPQARSLAQSADMCVVVTTCITHALTYGIGPYLDDPVYPQSSGSTSIFQAIERRARLVVAA